MMVSDLPYFEGLFILSLRKVYKSAIEYLNPLSWLCSSERTLKSALLCSFTSALNSSMHIAPVFSGISALKSGEQPLGGNPRNTNFLPPFLYIS